MNKRFPTALLVVALPLLAVLAYGGWRAYDRFTPGKYDQFAKCLGEKGAKFYGAYWCTHCKAEKVRFGKSAKYLPYIECAPQDSTELAPECKQNGVTAFPTWKFSDGTTEVREMELAELASRTGCELPK
jgi:hypothetical protein